MDWFNFKSYGSHIVNELKIVNGDNLTSGVLSSKGLNLLNELLASVRRISNIDAFANFQIPNRTAHVCEVKVFYTQVDAILLQNECF